MKPLYSEHILPSLYQGFTVLYDELAVSWSTPLQPQSFKIRDGYRDTQDTTDMLSERR